MSVPWLTRRLGNVGILTGPPFFAAIAEYMNGTNQLAIQGVDYPADITGFLEGGSPIGVAVMCVTLLSLSLAFTDISRGQTDKPHPRRLSQHAPPPIRLLARRTASAPGCCCCCSASKHYSEDLLRCLVW